MARRKNKWIGWAVAGGAVAAVGVYFWNRNSTQTHASAGLGAIRPDGTSFYSNMPKNLRKLPFNALRTELPLHSPARLQSMEQALAGEPDVIAYVPQNMGLTRYRQGAGEFGASIEGVVRAVEMRKPLLRELGATVDRVPRLTFDQAAANMNLQSPNTYSFPMEDPIAKGLSQEKGLTAYQLSRLSQAAAYIGSDVDLTPQVPLSPLEAGEDYVTVWNGRALVQVPTTVEG